MRKEQLLGEDIFAQLYAVLNADFSTGREQADALYRKTEDYLFAPLFKELG